MRVGHIILLKLGAVEVPTEQEDPQTEDEFLALNYVSPHPISWSDYQAKYNATLQNTALKQLRAERNRRIATTDWIMTVDNADSLANKNDWVAYRQALRDLPENPPTFVWKGPILDYSKMVMPVEPPVIRIGSAPAPEETPVVVAEETPVVPEETPVVPEETPA